MPIVQAARDCDGDVIMTNCVPTLEYLNTGFDFDFDQRNNTESTSPRSPRTPTFASTSQSSCVQSYSPTSFFSFTRDSSPQVPSMRKPCNRSLSFPPPPSKPLGWVWKCHLCHTKYPIGVTRRCLIDGHFYCSGNSGTTQKNVKKRKKTQACSSEFDYVGWEEWSAWRRKTLALKTLVNENLAGPGSLVTTPSEIGLRGCENCEFPSQCRYEKKKTTAKIVVDPTAAFLVSPKKADTSISPSSLSNEVEVSTVDETVADRRYYNKQKKIQTAQSQDSKFTESSIPPLPELTIIDTELEGFEKPLKLTSGQGNNSITNSQSRPHDSPQEEHKSASQSIEDKPASPSPTVTAPKKTILKRSNSYQPTLTEFFKGTRRSGRSASFTEPTRKQGQGGFKGDNPAPIANGIDDRDFEDIALSLTKQSKGGSDVSFALKVPNFVGVPKRTKK